MSESLVGVAVSATRQNAGRRPEDRRLIVGFLIPLVTNPSLAMYLLFSLLSGGRSGGRAGRIATNCRTRWCSGTAQVDLHESSTDQSPFRNRAKGMMKSK